MQEPIQEFASLMSSQDDELLALRMHPLQGEVSSDLLKTTLEEELVIQVNHVGVDVHFLQEHPHAVGMLQYVCGFGPRKAAALLKVKSQKKFSLDSEIYLSHLLFVFLQILKQEMFILQNRSQLVTQCSIGPQVFINSAGFLRINTAAYKEET